ncbi:hypothetical protein [Paenibacillus sp. P3E]|uniref:hypothetical protein n=1 Tax=Paenibacillus sp. P3E TaxID=1349435 RepID=UPI0011613F58|nr:hypothetical protein [Paenibacillus sp. P3E]
MSFSSASFCVPTNGVSSPLSGIYPFRSGVTKQQVVQIVAIACEEEEATGQIVVIWTNLPVKRESMAFWPPKPAVHDF